MRKLGCFLSDLDTVKDATPEGDAGSLPPARRTVDNTDIGTPWGALGNDVTNDCAVAAAGHAVQLARWGGAGMIGTSDDESHLNGSVLSIFHKVKKTQGTPPDEGIGAMDVFRYWHDTGIDGVKCGQVKLFNEQDPNAWKTAMSLFGCAFMVLLLPHNIDDPSKPNGKKVDWTGPIDWTDISTPPESLDPVKDCHCVIAVGYSDDRLAVVSHGNVLTMSWEFQTTYTVESYATLLTSWATGKEPGGRKLPELTKDFVAFSGWPVVGS